MGIRTDLEKEFDFEIVDDFVEHFEFMVYAMESIIISLEDVKQYEVNVNELFRIFHNIKSASAFLNIKFLNRLSFLAEDLLSDLRNQEKLENSSVIEWLLKVSDQLHIWKDNLVNDTELAKFDSTLLFIPDIGI